MIGALLIGMFLGIVLTMGVNFYIGLPEKDFEEKKLDKYISKKDYEHKTFIKKG
jgi:hypothetical protein